MVWIFLLLVVVAIAGYAIWRVRGSGRLLQHGLPELYVAPEEPRVRGKPDSDMDFIRGLQLPDSVEGLKPRPRPKPQEPRPAPAAAVGDVLRSAPAVEYAPVGEPVAHQNGYGDPTLQLLPGRLEVISGMPGDSIRFIKQPGVVQEVTLGRTKGEARSHIQLPSPTVSRMHVRMKFEGGRWTLENLSETNPVSINGRPATGRGARCMLSDGDRIELGDVSFFFRKR